jgi:DNA-binding response OmpR family regulator
MRAIVLSENVRFNKDLSDFFEKNGVFVDLVETFEDVDYYFSVREYDIFIADSKLIDNENEYIFMNLMISSNKLLTVVLGYDSGNKILNNCREIELLRLGVDEYIQPSANIEIIYLRIINYLKLNEARRGFNDNSIIKFYPAINTIEYEEEFVELTKNELIILQKIIQSNYILDKYDLLNLISEVPELEPTSKIDRIIASIRKKTKEIFFIDLIKTVPNRGYKSNL